MRRPLTTEQRAEIVSLLASGITQVEVASRMGISYGVVGRIARRRPDHQPPVHWLPTADEIIAACGVIQAEWTHEVEMLRRVVRGIDAPEVRVFTVSGLRPVR